MQKKITRHLVARIWILITLVAINLINLSGCKKAPIEKMTQVRDMFLEAERAGADNYAKAEYDAAKEQLSQAEYLVVVKKDYAAASAALDVGMEKAKLAKELAISNKERIESETKELIPKVENLIQDAKSVQKWAKDYADKIDGKILDELDETIGKGNQRLIEAKQALYRNDLLTAHWNALKIEESIDKCMKSCIEACKSAGASSIPKISSGS